MSMAQNEADVASPSILHPGGSKCLNKNEALYSLLKQKANDQGESREGFFFPSKSETDKEKIYFIIIIILSSYFEQPFFKKKGKQFH